MSHEHDLALRRKVLSVGIGNVMEWDDGNSAFLYALIVYSSAFAMRPVGGFVLGYIGDQLGRTTALIVSMCLMLAPSFLIGCLPTFQSAGYVSSILLLLCRLVQGFAGGGEMVSAIVYIVESTEKLGMPCFFGSICKASGNFGSTLGLGVVATLRALLSERAMLTWGWRIPFLMSIIFGALGMYLRSNLVETVEPSTPTSRVATDNEALLVPISDKENVLSRVATVDTWKRMIITIIIASTWSVAFYSILVWAAYFLADPSLSDTTCLNKRQIWITSFFMNVLVVILMPCFGFLGDAIGRGLSFLLTLSASILSVFAIPIFLLFRSNDVLSICFGYILFVIPISMFGANLPAFMVFMFEKNTRCTAIGIAFNLSNAIFAGTAPFIQTKLALLPGDGLGIISGLAPGLYIALAAFLTTCVIVGLPILLPSHTSKTSGPGESVKEREGRASGECKD